MAHLPAAEVVLRFDNNKELHRTKVGFDRKNIRCVMDRSIECASKGHPVRYRETGSVCAVVSRIVIRLPVRKWKSIETFLICCRA